jgi:hypothetical protein
MPAVRLKFHIERYGNIAHLWSSYALHSDGKQVARGVNSIQAIKEAGGWGVTTIMVQAESATAPLEKPYKVVMLAPMLTCRSAEPAGGGMSRPR